ncbi:MAG: ferric reductase-like transmembrane domain-containing protein [Pseudomonadales bacterium]
MPGIVAIVGLISASVFLGGRLPAGGWLWDLLNGIGLSACAVLAAIGWEAESPARAAGMDRHTGLGVVALLLVLGHAVGLLVYDPVLLEYLRPTAPGYMLCGLGALAALALLTLGSYPRPRRRLYGNHRRFRLWHRLTWLAVLLALAWHVIGSGFYLHTPLAAVVFASAVMGLPLYAYAARRASAGRGAVPKPQAAPSWPALLASLLLLAAAFSAARNL